MKSDIVFLPKVFPSEAVVLGQFLPNPLYPTIRSFRLPDNVISDKDKRKAEPEEPYEVTVRMKKEGFANVNVLRILGSTVGAGKADYLHIKAESSVNEYLFDPDVVFSQACQDQAVRIWMQDMAVYRKPFYMVIGLQVVSRAKFQRVAFEDFNASAKGGVPLDPSSLLTLEGKAGINLGGLGAAQSQTSGVLAIQVRKVVCEIKSKQQQTQQRQQQKTQQSTMVPATLTDEVHWAYSYQQKKGGPGDGNEQVVVASLAESSDLPQLEEVFQSELQIQSAEFEDDDDD